MGEYDGVYDDLKILRSGNYRERGQAGKRLYPIVFRMAGNCPAVRAGFVLAEDVTVQVFIQLLAGAVITEAVDRRNPEVGDAARNSLCCSYLRCVVRSTCADMASKVGTLAPQPRRQTNSNSGIEEEPTALEQSGTVAAGVPDPELVVDELVRFLYQQERLSDSSHCETDLQELMQTWEELRSLYDATATLPDLVACTSGIVRPKQGARSDEWKTVYNRVCQRHKRFRTFLRLNVDAFCRERKLSMVAREVVENSLDQMFPRRTADNAANQVV